MTFFFLMTKHTVLVMLFEHNTFPNTMSVCLWHLLCCMAKNATFTEANDRILCKHWRLALQKIEFFIYF